MAALFSKRIIGKHKNNKLLYYLHGYFVMWFNSAYKARKLDKELKLLNRFDKNYISDRLNYYNKLSNKTTLKNYIQLGNFKYTGEFKTYYLDTFKFIKYFNPKEKLSYVFGDVTHIPEQPTIVKSRPIKGDNTNSILLNLNKVRHFVFVNDQIPYINKKDLLIWRGKVIANRMPQRYQFFQTHFENNKCDIGAVNSNVNPKIWIKPRLTIDEQLQYKFILSLEGNDVATNLKWIMSSNSVAVMPKPKYETWFMEGTLIPDFHYICIKDDFSDLNEKLEYYTKNPEKTAEIINNSNIYINQFKNKKREKLISLLVLNKYFDMIK